MSSPYRRIVFGWATSAACLANRSPLHQWDSQKRAPAAGALWTCRCQAGSTGLRGCGVNSRYNVKPGVHDTSFWPVKGPAQTYPSALAGNDVSPSRTMLSHACRKEGRFDQGKRWQHQRNFSLNNSRRPTFSSADRPCSRATAAASRYLGMFTLVKFGYVLLLQREKRHDDKKQVTCTAGSV